MSHRSIFAVVTKLGLDQKAALWLTLISGLVVLSTFAAAPRYAYLAALGVVVGVAYLSLKGRTERLGTAVPSRRFLQGSAVAFFTLLSISIVLLRSPTNPNQRTIEHFIASSLMFGVLGAQIACGDCRGKWIAFVLGEIALASWWVRTAPQLLFPGVLGIDSWFHLGVVQAIARTGTIPTENVYQGLAQFHILAVDWAIIGGGAADRYLEALGPLLSVLGTLGIFLVGRRLVGVRTGLLAALVYGFSGYVVAMNYTFVAANLGAALLLLAVSEYFRYRQTKSVFAVVSIALLMFGLVDTHTVMALTLFLALLTLTVIDKSSRLLRTLPASTTGRSASLTLPTLFGVVLFGWWSYFSGSVVNLAQVIRWGFQFEPWTPTQISLSYSRGVPNVEYLLNLSGLVGIGGLALLGTLWLLSQLRSRWQFVGLAMTVWLFGALGLSSILLGLTGLIGLRWVLAFQLLAGLVAGIGVLFLANRTKRGFTAIIVTLVILGTVAFGNLSSPSGNVDTSVYSPNTFVRLAFTGPELQSLQDIAGMGATVYVVYPDYYYFLYYAKVDAQDAGPILVKQSFSSVPSGLLVIRTSSAASPIYFTQTLTRLPYDPLQVIPGSYSQVFDSGSVVAFEVGN